MKSTPEKSKAVIKIRGESNKNKFQFWSTNSRKENPGS